MKVELTANEWVSVHNTLDARQILPSVFTQKLEGLEKDLNSAERRIQGALERVGVRRISGLDDARGWKLKKSDVSKRVRVEMPAEAAASLHLFLTFVNAAMKDGGESSGTAGIHKKLHWRLSDAGAEVDLSGEDTQVVWVLQNGNQVSYSQRKEVDNVN